VDRGGTDVHVETAVRQGGEGRDCEGGVGEVHEQFVTKMSGELFEQQPAREKREQCKWTVGALTYKWKQPLERAATVEVARAA
jgi:hypothetical protein